MFHRLPDSPELKRDESVWNEMKTYGVGRTEIQSLEGLKSATASRLRHLKRRPDKVKSFFTAKPTT